jgi:hypothetical protein
MSAAARPTYLVDSNANSLAAIPADWPSMEDAGVPAHIAAVIRALRFRDRSAEGLASIPEEEWPRLIDWCCRKQLIVMLGEFGHEVLPGSVQKRIAAIRHGFEHRTNQLIDQLAGISDILSARGIEFVVLKGLSHSPGLTPNMLWRAQGDIDLWCQRQDVYEAHQLLRGYGYVQRHSSSSRHLAPLMLPNNWIWNGNYTEIPVGVELHHKLWSENSERIAVPGEDEMWRRRRQRPFFGRSYNVLAPIDVIGFAALHLLLHLLHGDLPLQRAWEIAFFLQQRSKDAAFWEQWRRLHPPELRELEALVFRIVQLWFWCDAPGCITAEIAKLPESAQLWLRHFPLEPLRSERNRNKNFLWLHVSLIDSMKDRFVVARQQLFPLELRPALERGRQSSKNGSRQRALASINVLRERIGLHAQSILPTLNGGFALWRLKQHGIRVPHGI